MDEHVVLAFDEGGRNGLESGRQMKSAVKQQWGKLTDDDLTQINGSQEKLEGIIQERYGIAKDETRKQIDSWYSTRACNKRSDERLGQLRRGPFFGGARAGLSLEP
jgi:uncharacterized protein YjbJ (UPF0337 family)